MSQEHTETKDSRSGAPCKPKFGEKTFFTLKTSTYSNCHYLSHTITHSLTPCVVILGSQRVIASPPTQRWLSWSWSPAAADDADHLVVVQNHCFSFWVFSVSHDGVRQTQNERGSYCLIFKGHTQSLSMILTWLSLSLSLTLFSTTLQSVVSYFDQ